MVPRLAAFVEQEEERLGIVQDDDDDENKKKESEEKEKVNPTDSSTTQQDDTSTDILGLCGTLSSSLEWSRAGVSCIAGIRTQGSRSSQAHVDSRAGRWGARGVFSRFQSNRRKTPRP